MGSRYMCGIGCLLLLHAASALGQQESSIRPSKTEVYSYSSNRGLDPTKQVRSTASTPHTSTHGIRLQYTLGIYINTTAATPSVWQLANASVDVMSTKGLEQDFGNGLVSALGQQIQALFPPGMKTVQVSNVQPGSPLTAEVVMYVNMITKPDPDGLHLGPCTVLEKVDNWFGNNLRVPLLSQLDPDFVSRYALSSITVNPSTENANDMHNCSYMAKYAGPVPTYVYIIVAAFGSLVLVCAMYKVCMVCRERCRTRTAAETSSAPCPVISVGPVTVRGLTSSTTGMPYPGSMNMHEQSPGVASVYTSNKEVSKFSSRATLAVYAESGVFESEFDSPVSDKSNAISDSSNSW